MQRLVFNYATYLASKGPLDARSLNQRVWDGFVDALLNAGKTDVSVIEAGAGIGAMFRRILQACLNHGQPVNMTYTLVDVEAENTNYFTTHFSAWLEAMGCHAEAPDPSWVLQERKMHQSSWRGPAGQLLRVEVVQQDIHAFIAGHSGEGWDALVAQAFLDLFDVETFVPDLLHLLKPAGLFYFPINFDGITSFLPPTEPSVDMLVESVYHKSMDDRSLNPSRRGRSQSGRHLMHVLAGLPVHFLEIGSSDWVVFPRRGVYIDSDKEFLAHILHFVEGELKKSNAVGPDVARAWIKSRQTQLDNNQLMLLVHQLDLLGQRS